MLRILRPCRERITVDKREIKDFPKLPSATSFIRETLDAIGFGTQKYKNNEINVFRRVRK